MAVTIVNRKRRIEKTFCELRKGDTFEHLGELYMKISPLEDGMNSVNLATGGLVWHGRTCCINPVDVELTIIEEKSNGECK